MAVSEDRALTDSRRAHLGAPPDVARVRIPETGLAHEVRAVRVVWQRELIRFGRDRLRIVTSLIQPILFLFVLGTGLSQLTSGTTQGVNLRTFLFPGALAMTVLFTSVFSAGSIVWDREFGFLREMLVAPISRASIVVGKALGGATVATFQGVILLLLAGLVGVPYSPTLILAVLAELMLLSFTLTAFGIMAAARIKSFQAFMALTQMLLMPLFFLSGALFPLGNLPSWLRLLTRVNPLTYAVDPIRRSVFAHLDVSAHARAVLAPGLTWSGWRVPIYLELLVVLAFGIGMLMVGVAEFRRAE
ncbi:MAG: ABC transporter permease [Frankiaceae bacterium]